MENTIFLTRPEYDSLITNYPTWMETNWEKYERVWSIAGVRVSTKRGSRVTMDELLEKCKALGIERLMK